MCSLVDEFRTLPLKARAHALERALEHYYAKACRLEFPILASCTPPQAQAPAHKSSDGERA